jgi:bifunctional N-acetylglucosamine-1-phosphate-uridyltransferase/glucosamine-1-phosphate-acetyltransferase GlmU-like protein
MLTSPMLGVTDLFDHPSGEHQELFAADSPVWSALDKLGAYLRNLLADCRPSPLIDNGVPLARPVVVHGSRFIDGDSCTIGLDPAGAEEFLVSHNGQILEGASLIMAGATIVGVQLRIGRGVLIESGAFIKTPVILDDGAQIRHGAYLRGNCMIGKRAVAGHATEVKNSIFLDDAKAGHFAYVGDSILGSGVNLGAGTKLANFKFTPGNVQVRAENEFIDSGRRKLGAILGDGVQTGCNSVTSPGTVLGKDSVVMPNITVAAGFYHARCRIRH